MCKRVIIDCSILWYKAWWRMKSPGYQAESSLELEEFARGLAGDIYELQQRFQAADLVLGIDSKEWRTPYFKQYFADRVHFWKSREIKNSWVMRVNETNYIIERSERTGSWSDKKATIAQNLALDLTDANKWFFFEKGKTPQYILDANPDTFKSVQECPDWEALQKRFPQYKGGRNSTWPFETSYKEFKKHARSLTLNIADTLGARAVFADWCEFDDLAHAYVAEGTASDTVLVTTDQDMDQLLANSMFLNIWHTGDKSGPARWVNMSTETANFHLLCKLVGGDSSDKIPGCITWAEKTKGPKNNKTTYRENTNWVTVSWETETVVKGGAKTADYCRKLMDEHGDLAGAHRFLVEHDVNGSYARNVAMMHLGAAPQSVKQACREALANIKVKPAKYQLSDYLLTDRKIRTIEQRAQAARSADLEAKVYEDVPGYPEGGPSPSDRLGSAVE